MREICDIQLRFDFYQSNSKISEKLEKMSEILQKDRTFLENIVKDFKTPKGSTSRAKGMTIVVESGSERILHLIKKPNPLVTLLNNLYAPMTRKKLEKLFYQFPVEIKLANIFRIYSNQD